MPINKITASKRGKAALAAAIVAAGVGGWQTFKDSTPATPPPAVVLATNTLIIPWEGLALKSHWDQFAKIWDICYGETLINGKPVQPGMSFTKAECGAMLKRRVFNDYYMPLVRKVPKFTNFPVSVQAAMVSGAYNFGVGGMIGSRAMALALDGKYREACEAQTAWNKAGGQVVNGLVKRREMGDAQRIGEAEVCVSGLTP